MQFVVQTTKGERIYRLGELSRADIRVALRGAHKSGNLLLANALFHEVYPNWADRLFRRWKAERGF